MKNQKKLLIISLLFTAIGMLVLFFILESATRYVMLLFAVSASIVLTVLLFTKEENYNFFSLRTSRS